MANAGKDFSDSQSIRCSHCNHVQQPGAKFCGVCGNEVADQYIGQVLNGRFLIESKIGEGGFGAVYRGFQKGPNRKVALKLLHPDMNLDENLVERFRREGLVLCNLRDAHTITTYDFDQTEDGTLYIAMELLEGRSLHDVFHREAPLDWRRMFKIVSEMCSSLAEAHAAGVVHRDLKPENIYLENRSGNPEFVKILDFGIAKVVHGDMVGGSAAQLTATGQTLGTLEYMSPEQLMGKELDGRSDVYALGVLAYEMITGRLPFPDAKGPAGLITAQLRQVPDPPSAVRPDLAIPQGVDQVILKSLEKDKRNRFENVEELRQACLELVGSGQWGPELTGQNPTPPPSDAARASRPATDGNHDGRNPDRQASRAPSHHGGALAQGQPASNGAAGMADQNRMATPPVAPMGYQAPVAARTASSQDSRVWLWIILALIVVGSAVGAALALA